MAKSDFMLDNAQYKYDSFTLRGTKEDDRAIEKKEAKGWEYTGTYNGRALFRKPKVERFV